VVLGTTAEGSMSLSEMLANLYPEPRERSQCSLPFSASSVNSWVNILKKLFIML
jgi:hypothetical protein